MSPIEIMTPGASAEEAAAIAEALERFMRDTAPPERDPAPRPLRAWTRAAVLEATGHDPHAGPAGWNVGIR